MVGAVCVAGWLRPVGAVAGDGPGLPGRRRRGAAGDAVADPLVARVGTPAGRELLRRPEHRRGTQARAGFARRDRPLRTRVGRRMQGTTVALARRARGSRRSEEHTSELQSLMRISYAVFCLKKKTQTRIKTSE